MKKTVRAIMSVAFASLLLCFTSCLAPATPDLGSGFVNNSGSNTNGTDSSSEGNWMLCKDSSYEIFDIQVWNGADKFNYENKSDCGRFTIPNAKAGWTGGGLISADETKVFDFSKVSKMKFEIRGTISEKSLSINVQDKNGGDDGLFPEKNSLANMAEITIKEKEWTVVELDVAKAAAPSAQIINAFCIIAAKDWGVQIESNQYFEIRNLDWVDSKGNSVKITLK